MEHASYISRRGELHTYFDKTAAEAWKRLTSDAPVSRIRATVRAGRDEMRRTLLSWLPEDLHGARLLDAGCGTGVLAIEAARRGADVVAIDLSPTLTAHAAANLPSDLSPGKVSFRAGDMLAPELGHFDFVVAMDSLIHYRAEDTVQALERLTGRTQDRIVFTFAPRTPMLAAMHMVGRLFPKSDRAPAIEPVSHRDMHRRLESAFGSHRVGRSHRITSGFYMSQAQELSLA